MRRISIAPLTLAALVFAACSSSDTPEAQVRKSLAAMESAAEERDVSEVMEWVSPEFRSPYGHDPDELRKYLYGLVLANQTIHLLTRIDSLEFPAPDEAQAHVTVGMVSREVESSNAWDLAADVHEFEVTLRRDDGLWKVLYAEHKSR
jgi:hypothetical protein